MAKAKTPSRPAKCVRRRADGKRCGRTPLLEPTKGEWICATHARLKNVGPQGAMMAERRRLKARKLAPDGADRGVVVGDAPHAAAAKRIIEAAGEDLEDDDDGPPPAAKKRWNSAELMDGIDLRTARGRHLALQRVAVALSTEKLTPKEADAMRGIVGAARRELVVDDEDDKIVVQWEIVTSREHVAQLALERDLFEEDLALRTPDA